MQRRHILAAAVALVGFMGTPLVASASVLCDQSQFSSITSPLSFASSIEASLTPSTTTAQTSTGTTANTSTEVCVFYVPAGTSSVCGEYQVTGTGTTANAASGTTQTIAAGEKAMADAQRLVLQYQHLQAKLCSIASLNGLAFSAWPDNVQSLVSTVTNLEQGTDTNLSDAVSTQSSVIGQMANNASQLSYIKNTLAPNVTGETSATQVNTALLELLVSQQQQEMTMDGASGAQVGNALLPMAPAMMGTMFDTNESADSGWYF